MPMFADFADPELFAILIPITALMGGIAIAVVAILTGARKKELEHKERLIAMEKGMSIPEPAKPVCRPTYQSNRTSGFVMTMIGIALTIALWVTAGPTGGVWGFIPLAIGIGLLISSALEKKESEK